jgi:hypothetical protein
MDDYLVSSGPYYAGMRDLPGGANIPIVKDAFKHNAAVELTIPINGYVARDKKLIPDVRKVPDYLKTAYMPEKARKNAPFTLTPDPKADVVYEDEFVNWVKNTFPYAATDAKHPIFFSLDNEPDWWTHVHPDIHPDHPTYAELAEKSVDYASAAKDVLPQALIFGPVNYAWHGYQTLQDAPDQNGRDFQEFYLQQMAAAEKAHGKRLLDVLDVHYYPEAKAANGVRVIYKRDNSAPVAAARVQAPRSMWDANFTEDSWITKVSTHGPIRLIPRLFEKIDKNYPGTKLAITEYDFGGGDHISGAIAQADALGIFGREGIFAAALWPHKNIPFTSAAFDCFRNFDGHNGSFGNTSIHAGTDDIEATSIYASTDSADPHRLVIVAINKSTAPIDAEFKLKNVMALKHGNIYQMTADGPRTKPAGDLSVSDGDSFTYKMPASSISTLQLSDGQP